MKQTIKTSRTAGYLEKIFRALNEDFFGGSIEEPIITIQSTPRAYGHVTVAKAWNNGVNGERRRELNIGAGTLNRPIENVVATMLHEMVHLYHLQIGIKDVSRGGAYHNKKFRNTAETVGLVISYDPRIGWSITEPSERLMDYIIGQGWDDIMMARNEGWQLKGIAGPAGKGTEGGDGAITKPKGHSRKYICPCCKLTVRATRDLTGKIKCIDCNAILIEK